MKTTRVFNLFVIVLITICNSCAPSIKDPNLEGYPTGIINCQCIKNNVGMTLGIKKSRVKSSKDIERYISIVEGGLKDSMLNVFDLAPMAYFGFKANEKVKITDTLRGGELFEVFYKKKGRSPTRDGKYRKYYLHHSFIVNSRHEVNDCSN